MGVSQFGGLNVDRMCRDYFTLAAVSLRRAESFSYNIYVCKPKNIYASSPLILYAKGRHFAEPVKMFFYSFVFLAVNQVYNYLISQLIIIRKNQKHNNVTGSCEICLAYTIDIKNIVTYFLHYYDAYGPR